MKDVYTLSTAYCPSIAYFFLVAKYKNIRIEQYETFPKQTDRNRTLILSDKGSFRLSVPVSKPNGSHSKTNEVEVCYKQNWVQKHWRAIESAYNGSPFFLYYKDEFKQILEQKHILLLDLNTAILQFFSKKLNIPLQMEFSTSFSKEFYEKETKDQARKGRIKSDNLIESMPPYYQVFSDRFGFSAHLSIMDLLFNMGNESLPYLMSLNEKQ